MRAPAGTPRQKEQTPRDADNNGDRVTLYIDFGADAQVAYNDDGATTTGEGLGWMSYADMRSCSAPQGSGKSADPCGRRHIDIGRRGNDVAGTLPRRAFERHNRAPQ